MTLENFIHIVMENMTNPDRKNIFSSALLLLSKNRSLLGESVIKGINDNGFVYNEIYNHYLFTLYSSPLFTVRLVFWQPVSLEPEKNTFIYNMKHNHDFEIFIVGYSGDGYETTIYRSEPSIMALSVGESPKITSSEKVKLNVGKLIHLRPFYDIHEQHPPESLSSSLSLILHEEKYKDMKSWSFSDNFSAQHSGVGAEERDIFNQISDIINLRSGFYEK